MPKKSHKIFYGKTVIILLPNTVSVFLVECDFLVGGTKSRVEVGGGNVPKTVEVLQNILFTIKLEI